MPNFQFDWFSQNIPSFERHLAPFRDQPCRVLEIGTHEGRAATWLLENILTHDEARIDCVDLYPQEHWQDNIRSTGAAHKASLHPGASAEVIRSLPLRSFDFIYIDGFHATLNVIEDAVLSFRLCKTNGVMAFDDYLWDENEAARFNAVGTPKPAVDFFLTVYGHKIELLEKGYSVWIRKLDD